MTPNSFSRSSTVLKNGSSFAISLNGDICILITPFQWQMERVPDGVSVPLIVRRYEKAHISPKYARPTSL
jgi:hypothetical protein